MTTRPTNNANKITGKVIPSKKIILAYLHPEIIKKMKITMELTNPAK